MWPSRVSASTTRAPALLSAWRRGLSHLHVHLTAPNGLKYEQPVGLFIDNRWTEASSVRPLATVDPARGTVITHVHNATPEDVDAAVIAARTAFDGPWGQLPANERGDLLMELGRLVEANKELLATVETWDSGKPFLASLEDVGEVVGCFKYYAGWADKIHGQVVATTPLKLAYTLREPLGVCAQIIPWNYPLAMAAWKLGPALACGNTVVLKPAEQTPLSILILANLVKDAGIPPGVVNIINGVGQIAGAALASHAGVDKVAFTGSTQTGREIMRLASTTLKDITLETGGKSPLLIFEDADLEEAIHWSHIGIMSNMGQICTATSRILVHETLHDRFVDGFIKKTKETSILGDPFDRATFQGPQIAQAQLDCILGFVDRAAKEGAKLSLGGRRREDLLGNRGFFVDPTVLTNVTRDMEIFREEVFGPVVVIVSFNDEDTAVELANDSDYGLGAAIFTTDISRGHRVARRLQSGTVWLNSSQDSDIRVPFGGVKLSGIGRELGEAALDAYTTTKAIHVKLN